jgi:hypothetical protein
MRWVAEWRKNKDGGREEDQLQKKEKEWLEIGEINKSGRE